MIVMIFRKLLCDLLGIYNRYILPICMRTTSYHIYTIWKLTQILSTIVRYVKIFMKIIIMTKIILRNSCEADDIQIENIQ